MLKNFTVRAHKVNDADIIEYLEGKENKQGTIKEAIREKMAREK